MRCKYYFKKLLFFMAILSLLAACSPETEPETNPEPVQEVSGDYQFTVSGDNNGITVTKYLGSEKHVDVPAEIDGKPVTAIGGTAEKGAFQDCSRMISVTIPEGVEEIQSMAFYHCTRLGTVYLPASARRLENSAFGYSWNIHDVYFAGNAPDMQEDTFVRSSKLKIRHYESAAGWTNPWHGYPAEVYGDYLYEENGDGTITIIGCQGGDGIGGKKVTAVADAKNTNADQRELAWIVTIADGVTEICDNALNGYKNLKTVTIPASVTVLGNHLFADWPNLERIYFEGDASRMGHYIFDYDAPVIFYYYEDRDGWNVLGIERSGECGNLYGRL